jgi:hypothetical protein
MRLELARHCALTPRERFKTFAANEKRSESAKVYSRGEFGRSLMSQWQNRMGTIRVSAMIVVLVLVGIILLLRH